mmetsp:Transcript_26519/g.73218  ORF Transcript_26519/g.73218 Transcript_26519/m.73218 type:complete len:80 (-) Transcript_26519:3604-3843(-)
MGITRMNTKKKIAPIELTAPDISDLSPLKRIAMYKETKHEDKSLMIENDGFRHWVQKCRFVNKATSLKKFLLFRTCFLT